VTMLRRAGVRPVFERWNGGHDRRYWSLHAIDYLRFYAGRR
jgi:enterochelin esterase-like enzyme